MADYSSSHVLDMITRVLELTPGFRSFLLEFYFSGGVAEAAKDPDFSELISQLGIEKAIVTLCFLEFILRPGNAEWIFSAIQKNFCEHGIKLSLDDERFGET